jgi:hypothetical protein
VHGQGKVDDGRLKTFNFINNKEFSPFKPRRLTRQACAGACWIDRLIFYKITVLEKLETHFIPKYTRKILSIFGAKF